MQHSVKNCISNNLNVATTENSTWDYENTIKILNSLQTNAQYLKVARKERLLHHEEYSKTILQTQKYLIRSGVTLETLDTLPVIHITGTKGKGTTCALSESILRHHGLKTGFYSSPHLVEVRERIRINGEPLQKNTFTKHFWNVYNKLETEKVFPNDMPMYFQFLTILAFKIFLSEKVDVAIIEVGIGGEYDSTNILRNVPVVGITSLGLDHTSILGNSLKAIAWHKSGIMKPNSWAFTVPQKRSVLKVLSERSVEKKSKLTVVQPATNLITPNIIHQPLHIYKLNFGLALALCESWINLTTNSKINWEFTKMGVLNCTWPGRYQILKHNNNVYYLDGAHTLESLQVCANWFRQETRESTRVKALVFNVTGDRDSKTLMSQLQRCNFQKVYFVPNKATKSYTQDEVNYNILENEQVARCYLHRKYWYELQSDTCNKAKVKVLYTVSEILQDCDLDQCDILITGSLHLVGAALSILDPNFAS